jgi:hypothetical protein
MLSPARGSLSRLVIPVSWDYIGAVDQDIGVVAKRIGGENKAVRAPTCRKLREVFRTLR